MRNFYTKDLAEQNFCLTFASKLHNEVHFKTNYKQINNIKL
jgi:hypothetical protein